MSEIQYHIKMPTCGRTNTKGIEPKTIRTMKKSRMEPPNRCCVALLHERRIPLGWESQMNQILSQTHHRNRNGFHESASRGNAWENVRYSIRSLLESVSAADKAKRCCVAP